MEKLVDRNEIKEERWLLQRRLEKWWLGNSSWGKRYHLLLDKDGWPRKVLGKLQLPNPSTKSYTKHFLEMLQKFREQIFSENQESVYPLCIHPSSLPFGTGTDGRFPWRTDDFRDGRTYFSYVFFSMFCFCFKYVLLLFIIFCPANCKGVLIGFPRFSESHQFSLLELTGPSLSQKM